VHNDSFAKKRWCRNTIDDILSCTQYGVITKGKTLEEKNRYKKLNKDVSVSLYR